MSKLVRISNNLYNEAKELAEQENRPISWQINSWLMQGKKPDKVINEKISEIKNLLKKHTIGGRNEKQQL